MGDVVVVVSGVQIFRSSRDQERGANKSNKSPHN